MPKILLTGSNSFVGNNYRRLSSYSDIDEISLHNVNLENIPFDKYDVIIHLAAIVHQSKNITQEYYFKINRDLCLNVARHAKLNGVRQFVFLSTIKVYGNSASDTGFWDENSVCFPDDDYGRSKYEAEIGLRKLEDVNFKVSLIRTPLVYGNGVKANMLNIIKLIDRFPFLPFAKIENKRNYTYVKNLVGFIDRIIDLRASGIFIAMDERAISTTELINFISVYLERKVVLFRIPGFIKKAGLFFFPAVFKRLFESLQFNNNQTIMQLSYKPPYSIEDGFKEMISFYKAQKNT
jgi:UDP-glucose 4-epimerase